ncbi:polysaccharide pyruvyl transferase family protein [Salinimicrobium oceani]|uniref:Polysaccharide pyruvyl transferase domain-containing protein n=1 Tax=Salinimicrobium oceani TaxID=2722702 RepID=A0ABX1CZM8_9FLAO|nr:polysaccharide pyruvyl transferase family protein [Salinimicrobium oceani]NJW53445.1 hypothetical protein [Salinimicrobium oceani]
MIPYDERIKFRDLSKKRVNTRFAKSKILNFYSSNNNIGNYTPVLGIQKLLNQEYDVWCAHQQVDWDFVNTNYEKVIIGGAGLFHLSFENFWKDFTRECKIPAIVWGVGGIFPKDRSLKASVNNKVLKTALRKCDLINLRDDLSADYVDLPNIHISQCPTISYVDGVQNNRQKPKGVLYSSHEELLNQKEKNIVNKFLVDNVDFMFTDNIQYQFCGMNRILDKYLKSKLIVTTRLHGAIIAYGLGIPYLAISFDEKVDEFYRLYGNGFLVKSLEDLNNADVEYILNNAQDQIPDLTLVHEFSNEVLIWTRDN